MVDAGPEYHAVLSRERSGPAPPPGKPHSYHFVVYALDAPIAQKPGTPPMTRAELLEAAKGHIIARGELVATYQRQ